VYQNALAAVRLHPDEVTPAGLIQDVGGFDNGHTHQLGGKAQIELFTQHGADRQ